MNSDQAIEKIKGKIQEIQALRPLSRFCPEFKKWNRDTLVLLQRVFGQEAYQVKDFTAIDYVFRGAHVMGDQGPFERRYRAALGEAEAILTSIHEEIAEYGLDSGTKPAAEPLVILDNMFARFHCMARQLRQRHDKRPTVDIQDEYDVQDFLHVLLKHHFKDVRPEEWTPSYAGTSSRMDFLLHGENLVIEVKMARRGLGQKEIVDQLLIDLSRYEQHPQCKTLVCFVYDPEGRIANPQAIIGDVEKQKRDLQIRVFVKPNE